MQIPFRLRRGRRSALGLLVAVMTGTGSLLTPAAVAATPPPPDAPVVASSPTGRYFVSLASTDPAPRDAGRATSPAALPAPADAVEEFVADLEGSEVAADVEVTATHETLWTGAVVDTDARTATRLGDLAGVTRVHPVLPVVPARTGAGQARADATLVPQAVDPAAGAGSRIAVIDSGLDIDHPAFGGGGMNGGTRFPNDVVVGGYDFVEGDARPDESCNGHGTHVAAVAAGRPVPGRTASPVGVAPAAQLLAYRVFGCDDSASVGADVIIDAMERAYQDGADVLNLSATIVGMSWADYPTAVAGEVLADNGVIVVAAQGNSATYTPSLFGGGAPAVGHGVIAVGAATAGGGLAGFSEWGPTAELSMRPDVLAPGENVVSAFPLEIASRDRLWESRTGTSMATPMISGLAAAMVQHRPGITPEEVAARVVGTARPARNAVALTHPPVKQGGGVVDPQHALATTLTAHPSRIDLGESGVLGARTVHLTLSPQEATTYQVRHEPALALQTNSGGGTAALPVESDAPQHQARVQVAGGATVVTTKPSGTTGLDLVVTPPTDAPAGVLYGGYVALVDPHGVVALRVPYQGMTGDFRDLPFHTAAFPGGPELRRTASCTSGSACAGGTTVTPVRDDSATFTLTRGDVPILAYTLAYPAADVTVEVERITADGSPAPLSAHAQPIVPPQPSGMTMRGRGPTELRWDGTYAVSTSEAVQDAPAGTYRLRFSASKPLPSEPAAPGDTTTWRSPAFAIRAGGPQWHLATTLSASVDRTAWFGAPSDTDVYVGDWDGDGVDGLAYRRGNTFFLRDSPSTGTFDREITFGRAGDPVHVGDWDGDGRDTFAVRRGNVFHFTNDLDGGRADWTTPFGRVDDEVVVGNWAGGPVDLPAVRRGNTYYFAHSFDGGPADVVQDFGRADDVVLPGDFDGDGTDTLAVRRGVRTYVTDTFDSGPAATQFDLGRIDDTPLVGTWSPGGDDTFGVHRRP